MQVSSIFHTDVLVLGGGLAGLRAAIAAREAGREVTVAHFARGASPFVLGCNIPIGPGDSAEVYFEDMVRGGYGLNDRRLVEVMAHRAEEAYRELAAIGVPFATREGAVLQRHLSGNTHRRSVYVAEGTGNAIMRCLGERCAALGIPVLSGRKTVSLLREDGEVTGALLWSRREGLCAVGAKAVVLALGGIGRLYKDSTYPADVSCHAYGLALEAGAQLIDMEFVQFEPVVTVWPAECLGMEMPTAMLGDGAHLLNAEAERFMLRYNPGDGEKRIEKAKMSLIIQKEIDEGRGFPDESVIFDTTVVPRDQLEGYVSHVKRLRNAGLDPATQSPRVRPAAHSQMGGVFIDETGGAGIPGLFVAGEAAGGAHGASRIAGNGCSDTLVTGALAGRGAAAAAAGSKARDATGAIAAAVAALGDVLGRRGHAGAGEIKAELRETMNRAAGIWRHADSAGAGQRRLAELTGALGDLATPDVDAALEMIEVRRMLQTGAVIVDAALTRTESRGAHQRTDYPEQDDEKFLFHIGYQADASGEITRSILPIH